MKKPAKEERDERIGPDLLVAVFALSRVGHALEFDRPADRRDPPPGPVIAGDVYDELLDWTLYSQPPGVSHA